MGCMRAKPSGLPHERQGFPVIDEECLPRQENFSYSYHRGTPLTTPRNISDDSELHTVSKEQAEMQSHADLVAQRGRSRLHHRDDVQVLSCASRRTTLGSQLGPHPARFPMATRRNSSPRRRTTKATAPDQGEIYQVYDPYRLLGRELRGWIEKSFGKTKEDKERFDLALQQDLEMSGRTSDLVSWQSENSRKAILYGKRRPPESLIRAIARVLLQGKDGSGAQVQPDALDRVVQDFLYLSDHPDCSLTAIRHCRYAKVRVGFVEFAPFVIDAGVQSGFIPDLVRLLFRQLDLRIEGVELTYGDMLDQLNARSVDLVVGLILETQKRRLRATFIDLDLPFRIGLNAVADKRIIEAPLPFPEAIAGIKRQIDVRRSAEPLVATISGEVGSEHTRLILEDDIESSVIEPGGPASGLSSSALISELAMKGKVVLADHVSCHKAVADASDRLTMVFKAPIGTLRGGLLSPPNDPQWAELIGDAWRVLLQSKLPAVMKVVLDHRLKTCAYVNNDEAKEWLNRYWDEACFEKPHAWIMPSSDVRPNAGS